MDLFENFLSFYDNNNVFQIEVQVPKRYIRDTENPIFNFIMRMHF